MAITQAFAHVPSVVRLAAYGMSRVATHYLSKKPQPLIRGLVLTNRCNLRCQHCRVTERNTPDMTFREACEVVDAYFGEGGRCLYLEGGEPFLWRDGAYRLEHIVQHAHKRGYLTVVVYTNGLFPIATTADTVFVSVDGLRATHDMLRGKSFDRIVANVQNSDHTSIFVNYTINRMNRQDIEPFCDFADSLPQVRAVFFYFHTPYYGYDALYLSPEERRTIILKLLELGKRHRILNSRAGLMAALRNDWKRPLAACSVYENRTVYPCCRFDDNPALCRDCGYLSYAEIDQTWKLKPSAVWNALKYF